MLTVIYLRDQRYWFQGEDGDLGRAIEADGHVDRADALVTNTAVPSRRAAPATTGNSRAAIAPRPGRTICPPCV